MSMPADSRPMTGDARTGGWILALASVVTVVAMAHHPRAAHGLGGIAALVHPAMMLLLALLFFGFTLYARRRGMARAPVLGGLLAYAISLVAHLGAATINGFVVPALAARGADGVGHDVFVLCWELNQALAKLGVVATGAAFVLWAVDLWRTPGWMARAAALGGLLAGALPAAAMLAGVSGMTVTTALAVYAAHAAWTLLIGVLMLRRAV